MRARGAGASSACRAPVSSAAISATLKIRPTSSARGANVWRGQFPPCYARICLGMGHNDGPEAERPRRERHYATRENTGPCPARRSGCPRIRGSTVWHIGVRSARQELRAAFCRRRDFRSARSLAERSQVLSGSDGRRATDGVRWRAAEPGEKAGAGTLPKRLNVTSRRPGTPTRQWALLDPTIRKRADPEWPVSGHGASRSRGSPTRPNCDRSPSPRPRPGMSRRQ